VINENGGRFAGLDRFAAREAVKEALAAEGALVGVVDHVHAIGHCQRCHTVIEPYLSDQWFVKVEPLVGPAIEAVRSGEIRFVPERWDKTYFHWMENLRDWTISRQIWWGHRIPAWYCDECGEVIVAEEDPTVSACGSTALRQDPDVLDTWFSSGLFPFSTLGWPEDTEDYRTFYPNAVLVTGYDIISFWVARMIQFGLHLTGRKPFSDVVIHGLVRAEDGRKMSKSLGNAVDPLEVVEVHGADALRLALIQAAAAGQDVPFQTEWVDAARRFGNKLWNAVRFAVTNLGEQSVPADGGYPDDPGPESAWILSRLHDTFHRADELVEEYRFSESYAVLYSFAWSEAFDWYLELSKTSLRADSAETRATLGVVLRDLLKLFHPVMPYVTEELWSYLVGDGLIAAARWPDPPRYEEPAHFEVFRDLVVGFRRFRAEHGLSPRAALDVTIADPDGVAQPWWFPQFEALASVAPAVGSAPEGTVVSRVVAGPAQAFITLEGLVDVAAERARLDKEIDEIATVLERSRAKLAKRDFVDKAPAEVVAKERAKVAEFTAVLDKLSAQRADLG